MPLRTTFEHVVEALVELHSLMVQVLNGLDEELFDGADLVCLLALI